MPPLVAMEGMQANQEAEFMSMNMSNQHQNMPSHEEAGKKSFLTLWFSYMAQSYKWYRHFKAITLFHLDIIEIIQINLSGRHYSKYLLSNNRRYGCNSYINKKKINCLKSNENSSRKHLDINSTMTRESWKKERMSIISRQ